MSAWLGIGGTGSNGDNQYTTSGFFNQPYYNAIGTVLTGLQGGQCYDVAIDGGSPGRVKAMFLGTGRGLLGASEAGGILPGERVLVGVAYANPASAVILAKMDYARSGDYRASCTQLVYPQVAGFEPGERMSGEIYENFPRFGTNWGTGIPDVLDGEWHQHNFFGAGVGVEMFRAYMRGGPASGIYFYSEDQHTRIMGAKLEFLTFGSQDESSVSGQTTTRVLKRYFYSGDQEAGYQAQALEAVGPAYGGYQQFISYPDGVNGSGVPPLPDEDAEDEPPETVDQATETDEEVEEDPSQYGTSRVALIHEYRGYDGNYVLTAAASLTLQKSLEVPMPIDVIEARTAQERQANADEADEADEDAADCGCDACPLDPDPEVPGVTDDSDADTTECEDQTDVARFDSNASAHPLAFAMNARGLADRLVLWQATGAFDNLCSRWAYGETPEDQLYGGRTPSELTWSPSPAMWKCMPQTVKLSITPDGTGKRFYFGRALISITEDGSVVLQDAQGSQIMLSGGNIYMSANHDIIRVAGRNLLDVAGRDAAIRAGRHLDAATGEGRMTLTAQAQMTIVGGLDGFGGVLLESQGEAPAAQATGENPATSGGLILRAKQKVGIAGGDVVVRARGDGTNSEKGGIILDAEESLLWQTEDGANAGGFGRTIWGLTFDGSYTIGNGRAVFDVDTYFNKTLIKRTERRIAGQSPGVLSAVIDGARSTINNRLKDWTGSAVDPLVIGPAFAAGYLTSAQYTLPDSRYFQIPEPEWQRRAKEQVDESSAILTSLMTNPGVNGTSPLPGGARWANDGMATGSYSTPGFNGRPTVDLAVGSAGLNKLLKGI